MRRVTASAEKNQAASVKIVQAAIAMISARRSPSRCWITDMRPSGSLGTEGEGPRPLVSRAMPGPLALALSVGLRGLGRGCRCLGRDRRSALRRPHLGGGRRALLLGGRRLHVVDDLVGLPPELPDAAPDGAAQLGQLARAEYDQNDHQQDDQEAGMNPKRHLSPLPRRDYTHWPQP